MPVKTHTRRRVLTIMAAGAGALATGLALGGIPPVRALREFKWRGVALGADASLTLCHDDEAEARAAIAACLEEVERLEQQFSLYRSDSALSQLNRDGRLPRPSLDMIALLRAGRRLSEVTEGAFDYTIQPLWQTLAADRGKPPPEAKLGAALDLVDYKKVAISPAVVTLGAGQEITLNGIAQGYITDRVTEILHHRGWQDVLVGLGEARASGRRIDGAPWKIDVGGGPQIALESGAIAVSAGAGLYLDDDESRNHLIDPRDGDSPSGDVIVAVRASNAMLADGLSTALAFLPFTQWSGVLKAAGADEAWQRKPNSPARHVIRQA